MSKNWDQDTYLVAWNFASLAHEGQVYSGSEQGKSVAYINHIGCVAMELIAAISCDDAVDGNLAIQCGLLHDTIEDTEVTYRDITSSFGKAVADGVLALTKNQALPTKHEQMQDSLERITHQPQAVWMVKMADRICNLQQPPYHWKSEKILKYYDEALMIHDVLHSAHSGLARRLEQKIENYRVFF